MQLPNVTRRYSSNTILCDDLLHFAITELYPQDNTMQILYITLQDVTKQLHHQTTQSITLQLHLMYPKYYQSSSFFFLPLFFFGGSEDSVLSVFVEQAMPTSSMEISSHVNRPLPELCQQPRPLNAP